MSWSRRKFDNCEYYWTIKESTSPLNYSLDPSKFYNCNECRVPFGLLGGNNVSRYTGNLVDLENDLRGQTRPYSRCPEYRYLGPKCSNCPNESGLPCSSTSCKQDKKILRDLPECYMIQYKPKVNNKGYQLAFPKCPITGETISGPPKIIRSDRAKPNEAYQGRKYPKFYSM